MPCGAPDGEEVQVLERVAREPDRLALVDVERDAARVRELQRRGQRHAGAGGAGRADRRDLRRSRGSGRCRRRTAGRRRGSSTEATFTFVSPTARRGGERRHPAGGHAARELEAPCRRPRTGGPASTGSPLEIVDGYGFSSMFESWTPPTLKPGMPRFQNAEASSSVERICASGAVPAGCTGEYAACSAAV